MPGWSATTAGIGSRAHKPPLISEALGAYPGPLSLALLKSLADDWLETGFFAPVCYSSFNLHVRELSDSLETPETTTFKAVQEALVGLVRAHELDFCRVDRSLIIMKAVANALLTRFGDSTEPMLDALAKACTPTILVTHPGSTVAVGEPMLGPPLDVVSDFVFWQPRPPVASATSPAAGVPPAPSAS